MLKYAKIIDDETKECRVGLGKNEEFYQSLGMSKMEVEQGYNGLWYVTGYAPEPDIEKLKTQVRDIRNQYLQGTDFTQLSDAPFTEEGKLQYADYRQYLRDYTKNEEWWLKDPKTFDEWNN